MFSFSTALQDPYAPCIVHISVCAYMSVYLSVLHVCLSLSVYMCVCLCVFVPLCVYLNTYLHIWKPEVNFKCHSPGTVYLILSLSLNLKLTNNVLLACQRVSGILYLWDSLYTCTGPHVL